MQQLSCLCNVKRLGLRRLVLTALVLTALVLALRVLGPSRGGAVRGQNPLIGLGGKPQPLRGVIVEVLRAGSYRYIRLRDEVGKEHWVVTLGDSPPVGAAIEGQSYGQRLDFQSPRLGRRFARLHFGLVHPL